MGPIRIQSVFNLVPKVWRKVRMSAFLEERHNRNNMSVKWNRMWKWKCAPLWEDVMIEINCKTPDFSHEVHEVTLYICVHKQSVCYMVDIFILWIICVKINFKSHIYSAIIHFGYSNFLSLILLHCYPFAHFLNY